MTREEAILLSAYTGFLLAPDFSEVHKFCEDTLGRPIWTHEFADSCVQKEIQEKLRPQIMELVQNIVALRPISRDHAEKAWRGEWIYDPDTSYMYCEICKHTICQTDYLDGNPPPFCEICGAPMTDEAVQMVLERLEALYEKTD